MSLLTFWAVMIEFIVLFIGTVGLSKLVGDPESELVRHWVILMVLIMFGTMIYGVAQAW